MSYRQNQEIAKANLSHQMKYDQMTKQQQLIEQKKLEIQKKLEEKKKKEIEEALKKLNDDKQKSSDASKSKRNYHGYSKSKHWSAREKPVVEQPAVLPANIFSNDGSFLEQFQKLSGVKVTPRKKTEEIRDETTESQNGNEEPIQDPKPEENEPSNDVKQVEDKDKRRERRWSSPDRSVAPNTFHSPQENQYQRQPLMMQQNPPQNMQNPRGSPQTHPGMQPQMFGPPHPMPPNHMRMPNFSPQFNPMQCGMMLPPPMTPASIPPPAPLNPNSIPSPSPLQPYSIPPPSPLMPHSIPPPRPMVPHSIPPPSPLTPHSIPPPLPLRPQNIPPPLQRPPMFLSMVPPPPPPPPQDDRSKTAPNFPDKESKYTRDKESRFKDDRVKKHNIEDNVKDLFRNDDYSSSEDESSRYSPGKNYSYSDPKEEKYSPEKDYNYHSDSDSEPERKSAETNSNKESDAESYQKIDSLSGMGSDSHFSVNKTERNVTKLATYGPIIIEDTQTQFPSDTKDSSQTGEAAPTDLSSGEESRSGERRPNTAGNHQHAQPYFWQDKVKSEPVDRYYDAYGAGNSYTSEKSDMTSQIKQEFKTERLDMKTEIKQENSSISTVKQEEPPVKKKRRSRWASEDDKVAVVPPPGLAVPPPGLSVPPPGMMVPPPGLMVPPPSQLPPGPPGMVVPTALGGVNTIVPPLPPSVPTVNVPGMSGAMISKVTRTDPALMAYAMKSFGRTNLTPEEWKKAEDHFKINLLYQDMMRKKEELERLQAAGKHKYEYDSDEETEGGTWEHKLRNAEMEATQKWAEELTEQAKGKHHIGDFLPPDELARFMEKYEALKQGREPDLSDYKEFKLKEDNVGFQMLQKMGWTDGQGLGPDGSGIQDPVNKASMRTENQGLGMERPDDVDGGDDEYDAYRKRMMLAYRFRPNPMNNPRRPYY